ncbi:hypothetical protein S7S_09000 [Isoalcanivorax pacificus W11-5]|uniref:DsrE/DsrF-like family protein n=1 Tax=Isoalcanivorax pacificus W11-5 TaxID=391936 RepID=A0A0B4XIS7_9GAMM|nr:DsrE family protein [Isoalcanivorax pacificus]AJD48214.1 hypothetical protein S7S_09000 [Isoalcanivorax pacificus W11-5]
MSPLLICRTPPHQDDSLAELLDMALTLAAFGQSVTLLFLGEAIQHLIGHGPATGRRDITELLNALSDYGITCAAPHSALETVTPFVPVTAVNDDALPALLAQASHAWGW